MDPTRWAVAIAGALAVIAVIAVLHGHSNPDVSGVHLAWGSNASSDVTVTWLGPPADSAHVAYGTGEELDRTVPAKARRPLGSPSVVYTVELTGLSPNTTYRYRAVTGTNASSVATFPTAPRPGTTIHVTITPFADHGTVHPQNPRADGHNPQRVTGLAASLDPAFHLHAGDTSSAEGDPNQWNR
jgi:phosphodiesterase/alkaline phosphatase D-like protein